MKQFSPLMEPIYESPKFCLLSKSVLPLPLSNLGHWGGIDFILGTAGETITTPNVSIIVVPYNSNFIDDKEILNLRSLIISPKTVHSGYYKLQTCLVLDTVTPRMDPRIFTPHVLSKLQLLRMNILDWQEWHDYTDNEFQDSAKIRERVFQAQTSAHIRVPPYALHWKIAVWPDQSSLNSSRPSADWHVCYSNTNAMAYANNKVSPSTAAFICQNFGLREYEHFFPALSKQSWVSSFHKIALQYRIFSIGEEDASIIKKYSLNEYERNLYTFGILKDSRYSYKREIHKQGNALHSDLFPECFEGFASQSMQEILKNESERSQCLICVSNKVQAILDCGHTFCTTCIQTLITTQDTSCPNCRAQFHGFTIPRRETRSLQLTAKEPIKKAILQKYIHPNEKSLVIVPNSLCAEIVDEWLGKVHILTLDGSFEALPREQDHILISYDYVSLIKELEIIHRIIQFFSKRDTRITIVTENAMLPWMKHISASYSSVESSTYE